MESSLVGRDVEEGRKERRRKRKPCDRKNQPLKVVYISNPMRVQASAAEFRGLVQQLTGQDAPKFPPSASVETPETNVRKIQDDDDDDQQLLLHWAAAIMEDSSDDFLGGSYESLEGIFMRDMVDRLAA